MSERTPAGPSRVVRQDQTIAQPEVRQKHPQRPVSGPKQRKARPQKPPKPPLEERLPPGVYAARPRMKRYVLHWLWFWVYARFGLYRFGFVGIPPISLHERFRRLDDDVYRLSAERRLCAAVGNSKGGGGKTPTATWTAVALRAHGKRSTLVLEANENAGNAAAMMGVDRSETLLLRGYLASLDSLSSHAALDDVLGHHRATGTAVIGSDPNSNRYFSGRLYVRGAHSATLCYAAVIQDCGNGLANVSNLGAMRVANVPIITACSAKPSSYIDAESTFSGYRDNHKMADKMTNSALLVLLGHKPGDVASILEEYKMTWSPDQVKVIPYDRYMANDKNKVDLTKIKLKTYVALLELVKAALERAPHVTEPILSDISQAFPEYKDDLEEIDTAGHAGNAEPSEFSRETSLMGSGRERS